jgi:hypothetical protein
MHAKFYPYSQKNKTRSVLNNDSWKLRETTAKIAARPGINVSRLS